MMFTGKVLGDLTADGSQRCAAGWRPGSTLLRRALTGQFLELLPWSDSFESVRNQALRLVPMLCWPTRGTRARHEPRA
jgi:hypothetical protein